MYLAVYRKCQKSSCKACFENFLDYPQMDGKTASRVNGYETVVIAGNKLVYGGKVKERCLLSCGALINYHSILQPTHFCELESYFRDVKANLIKTKGKNDKEVLNLRTNIKLYKEFLFEMTETEKINLVIDRKNFICCDKNFYSVFFYVQS